MILSLDLNFGLSFCQQETCSKLLEKWGKILIDEKAKLVIMNTEDAKEESLSQYIRKQNIVQSTKRTKHRVAEMLNRFSEQLKKWVSCEFCFRIRPLSAKDEKTAYCITFPK